MVVLQQPAPETAKHCVFHWKQAYYKSKGYIDKIGFFKKKQHFQLTYIENNSGAGFWKTATVYFHSM